MVENSPGITEILAAAFGTLLLSVLGYYLRTRFPQLLNPPTKTVISELPKIENGSLATQKDHLSLTLAKGVLRSAEVIERLLVQSMALNEQYQQRVDELEDREVENELLIAEYKRRLEDCEELQSDEK